VGLELGEKAGIGKAEVEVTIPHGGLGTGFLGQVDRDGFHVTIPHCGLRPIE